MVNSREAVLRDLAKQETVKKQYLQLLKKLPMGKLTAAHMGNSIYYTEVKDGKKTYLGRDTNPRVRELQKRYFLERALDDIEDNLNLMREYEKAYKPIDAKSILQRLPKAYQSLTALDGIEADGVCNGHKWEQAPYDKNEKYPEGLVHRTLKGENVRSKSEALLANMLYEKGIPYHYEEKLTLSDHVVVPDFTIFVESENRFKLLEHCGLIGNEKYATGFTWKLQMYIRNGYMPWRDVFFTFDEDGGSIDTLLISEIMDTYFR